MTVKKSSPDLDLPIHLERNGKQTLQQQLIEQLRKALCEGKFPAGARLPSTRTVARALAITRNVVITAYEVLISEGYLVGQHGSGTYVSRDFPMLPRPPSPAPRTSLRWLRRPALRQLEPESSAPGIIAFQLGVPSISSLPLEVWRRAWREVAALLPPNDYGPLHGDPVLRTAIASYLGRARGISCGPEEVIITSGAIQALDLVALAAITPGDFIGFEEPGPPSMRETLLSRGARIFPIPIDGDGLQVDSLPCGLAAPLMVYTTPSHQFPLGMCLSFARRMALLEWAETSDSLILEDDYDSEFRFGAPPLPALAGLDKAGRVAYIGTFSKVLTPALRIGYLVAPLPLRERIEQLKHRRRLTSYRISWPVQRALATLLTRGDLERHIRRMRRHYQEKRAALSQALAPVSHLARLQGLDAGLHAYLELRSDLDPLCVARLALERGVTVTTLNSCYYGVPDRRGILLGYGGLELGDVVRGAQILALVIEYAASHKVVHAG